jgi:hypothetical protein
LRTFARTAVVLLIGTALVVVPAVAAFAGDPGDNLNTAPLLLGGPTYGERTDTDSTAPNGKVGHPQCGVNEGASAYSLGTVPANTRVSITITQGAIGDMCGAELLFKTNGANTLNSLYQSDRANFVRGFSTCALTMATCQLEWRTLTTDVFYLAFWPGDNGGVGAVNFGFTVKVRQPTSTTMSVSGAYKGGQCAKVHYGRTFTATATVSPTAAGTIRFTLQKLSSGSWVAAAANDVLMTGSSASKSYRIRFARYRLRADYLNGSTTLAPSYTGWRCIDVVTPSSIAEKFHGYYDTHEDYFVYHSGRTITVTATVAQTPATGFVVFRYERENNNRTYHAITTYKRRVVNSRAVLQFTRTYRAGLPYYRLRAEYLGDSSHLAKNSVWICVQINR